MADYICQWRSCDGKLFYIYIDLRLFRQAKPEMKLTVGAFKCDKVLLSLNFIEALMPEGKRNKLLSLTYQVVQLPHWYVRQISFLSAYHARHNVTNKSHHSVQIPIHINNTQNNLSYRYCIYFLEVKLLSH